MRIAIDDYVSKMHRGDISFFFYSGHGIQVRGENYLVPVDFAAQSEADVEDDGFRVGHILEKLEETAPSVNIVVLDACRNNPFLPNKGLVRGLAGISTSGTGSLIAFATSPGKVADDGAPGGYGIYTASLLKYLNRPGIELETMFRMVREDVFNITAEKQVPWTASSIVGTIVLSGTPRSELP